MVLQHCAAHAIMSIRVGDMADFYGCEKFIRAVVCHEPREELFGFV